MAVVRDRIYVGHRREEGVEHRMVGSTQVFTRPEAGSMDKSWHVVKFWTFFRKKQANLHGLTGPSVFWVCVNNTKAPPVYVMQIYLTAGEQ